MSQEEHEKEWKSSHQYHSIKNLCLPSDTLGADAFKAQAQQEMIKNFGDGWLYNDIIGYIRLHVLGTQIRGEYYCHKKKISRKSKRIFERKTHKLADEIYLNFPEENTNEVIFTQIKSYIDSCRKELNKGRSKKKYTDDFLFEQIGKYVDWRRLIHTEQGS